MNFKYLEKVGFVLSVAMLGFFYGFTSHAWNWFPKSALQQAQEEWHRLWEDKGLYGHKELQVYEREGVRRVKPEKMQPGVTLVSSLWEREGKDFEPELRLLDENGNVLHEWRVDTDEVFQNTRSLPGDPSRADVHGSYLLPEGDVVVNVSYVGMVRMDACGAVRWTLAEGNHHSITQAEDGSFWVPGRSHQRRIKSRAYPDGYPGLKKDVYIDRILKVSGDGKILKDINLLDVFYKNDLEYTIFRYPNLRTRDDITHLNDVEPLSSTMADEYPLFETGDLVVSVKNMNIVFVLDPDSEKVKWHATGPFLYQHDPDFIGNGWIGIFDNRAIERGSDLGGSRIVAYQPHTDSMEVRFPTQHSEPFYTKIQGKWQQLDNGNMLLTESRAGRISEVDSNGRTVWEWVHAPTANGRVPVVTKASRHSLSRSEIASWPCSSVDSTGTSDQESPSQNQQKAR